MPTVWRTPDDAAPNRRPPTDRPPASAARALIVGEDARALRWVGEQMRQAGFEVLTADDGLGALNMAHREPPDLVILDHIVAGVDVRYVLAELRRNPCTAHIPILLLTPCASNSLEATCHRFRVTLLVTGMRKPDAGLRVHLPPPRAAHVVWPGDQTHERRR